MPKANATGAGDAGTPFTLPADLSSQTVEQIAELLTARRRRDGHAARHQGPGTPRPPWRAVRGAQDAQDALDRTRRARPRSTPSSRRTPKSSPTPATGPKRAATTELTVATAPANDEPAVIRGRDRGAHADASAADRGRLGTSDRRRPHRRTRPRRRQRPAPQPQPVAVRRPLARAAAGGAAPGVGHHRQHRPARAVRGRRTHLQHRSSSASSPSSACATWATPAALQRPPLGRPVRRRA